MPDRGAERERSILAAWHANASPWTAAVRGQRIESRRLVTDRAIVDAVLAQAPHRVIDLGCGEGWLVRALAARGIDALGVDAVAALVEAAAAQGGGRYRADVVVCNFSLLGAASVDALLRAVPAMLDEGGVLIVQTLHPLTACGELPYRDGWREGSWQGCGEGFGDAAPWYFRTLAGWLSAFAAAGLRLRGLAEPEHPHSGRPASVIFTLAVDA
ncbi:methyltransferase type 12 [Frateuria sp. Soil773]|uniref:class I SAM-dependent methyltransferase n=1 Tax=Frateuria sp. Soil773 TaxID=1736407 RepID=UPI0006FDAA2A|nr:methyltransferase domain-containing protein [Frateuria sp. Soil773]KRE90090.1 methyltransferase type 12 [Frateuria sp. Soil773]